MNKKTLYIIGATVLILVIGIGAYFLFFRNKATENSINNESPFGSGGPNQERPASTNQPGEGDGSGTISIPVEVNTLWKISENPVSGATIVGNASGTLIYYVDKATGHIYEVNVNSKSVERISNTTIPKTERIVWGKNAKSIIFQYENNGIIKSYYAKIGTTTATTTAEQGLINGKYLDDNINSITNSPPGDKVFYSQSIPDSAALVASNLDGSAESVMLATHFKGWVVSWPKETLLAITTKASSLVPGFLYFMDPKTKILDRVLGDILGLTALVDRTGENVLYSKTDLGKLYFGLFNKKSRLDSQIHMQTLPEKCVWGTNNLNIFYCGVPKSLPAGEYPDMWYQGKTLFSDNIWQFDITTGGTERVVDPKEKAGEEIDVIDPMLSSSGNILIFRNKIDFSLWGLTLDPIKTPILGD